VKQWSSSKSKERSRKDITVLVDATARAVTREKTRGEQTGPSKSVVPRTKKPTSWNQKKSKRDEATRFRCCASINDLECGSSCLLSVQTETMSRLAEGRGPRRAFCGFPVSAVQLLQCDNCEPCHARSKRWRASVTGGRCRGVKNRWSSDGNRRRDE
jgi:hypothetical protein